MVEKETQLATPQLKQLAETTNSGIQLKSLMPTTARGANKWWLGAPLNLFSSNIYTTSSKKLRSSTNIWTKEVWRCT